MENHITPEMVKEYVGLLCSSALELDVTAEDITETENDAKKAINFLKESKAGRATFLPLTSVKGTLLQEKGLDDCYGYINLASELVEYAVLENVPLSISLYSTSRFSNVRLLVVLAVKLAEYTISFEMFSIVYSAFVLIVLRSSF